MRIDQFMIMSGEAADRIDGVLLLVRPDGSIFDANSAALDCYGYSRAQMLALSIHDIRATGDAIDDQMRKAAERGVLFEAVHRRSDGSLFPIEVRWIPVCVDGETALLGFVSDITERKHAEEELRESENRFRTLFYEAPLGIALVDSDTGRIYEVNRRFAEITGRTRAEMKTIDWMDITHPDDVQKDLDQLARLNAGEIPGFQMDKRYLRPDGSTVWVGMTIAPLDEPDLRRKRHLCMVVEDITVRKQAEEEILGRYIGLEERVQERTEELNASNEELASANSELTEANRQLEDATRAKSDFLASMSHELRTPLNSIIGFSGIMLQGLAGELNEEQNKQVGMINNSGRHLLELVNEVLDLAKVESAQDRPMIRKVDVGALSREMFDTVRPMAAAKGIEMRWTCPEDLRLIPTDRLRVGQILLNLMGNAVKFTEHGCISATVSQDGSGVVITVEDSGCGIAAEDLKRVFGDFYQVSPRISAKSEGTGLGLAVSRRLAESIGARIEVTSEPGRGSVFTLRIPERQRERDLPVGQSRIEL